MRAILRLIFFLAFVFLYGWLTVVRMERSAAWYDVVLMLGVVLLAFYLFPDKKQIREEDDVIDILEDFFLD